MRIDLAALDPQPTAFVANLPYNVAAPLILRSIDALPAVRTWCCLIQREVADRFLAGAGDSAYGAPSVLCGLALEPVGRHAVSRSVFVPVPNVDSSLVAFRRREDWNELAARWPAILAVVSAGFSHRRKTLANSLALAGWGSRAEIERVCAASRHRSADPRRGAAAPGLPRACDRPRRGAGVRALAPAKVNLLLRVGPQARRRLPRAREPDRRARRGGRARARAGRRARPSRRRRSPAATRS